MAKRQPKPADMKKAEFEQYVRRSSDSMLVTMLSILDNQLAHPDYLHRCWAGSSHNVPITEVITVLNAEKKRRDSLGSNDNESPSEGSNAVQVLAETAGEKPKRTRRKKTETS